MNDAPAHLIQHLLRRLNQVRQNLDLEPFADDPAVRFAEALDSMAFVEFLALVADDCGVRPEAIERVAWLRFGTVMELASALATAGMEVAPDGRYPPQPAEGRAASLRADRTPAWL